MHQRPAHRFAFHHADRVAFACLPGEALEHAACAVVDHRGVDHDAVDLGRGKHPMQMRHHPGERRQRIERRFLGRDLAVGCAEQPAAAGINEAWLDRLGGQRRQQHVEQAAIEPRLAGHMDNRIDARQCFRPSLG